MIYSGKFMNWMIFSSDRGWKRVRDTNSHGAGTTDEKGVALATSLYRYLTASRRGLQRQARCGARHFATDRTGALRSMPSTWLGRNGTGRGEHFISNLARLRPDQAEAEMVTCSGVRELATAEARRRRRARWCTAVGLLGTSVMMRDLGVPATGITLLQSGCFVMWKR